MVTTNAGKPLRNVIKLCYLANCPPLVQGPHGVGKSEMFAQAAREMGIQIICRDLSLMEPPDLVGMPSTRESRTIYYPPAFLPRDGKGILLFEELNRCPSYMRAPCLQLLTARSLNDYELPKGWLPAAAINPPGDDYDVADLDPALLSRFVQVAVRADREEWLAWASENDVDALVIEYIRSDTEVFTEPSSNPRAWKYVSDLLRAPQAEHNQALRTAISGLVGETRAAAFLAYMANRIRPLTPKEILNGYPHHRARVREWIAAGRLDLIRGSLLELFKQLQTKRDFATVQRTRKAWSNLGNFLKDLPGDIQEEGTEFFVERGYQLPVTNRSTR